MKLKGSERLYYFFITKDSKYLVLFHDYYSNIDFYSTKTFKKIAMYKNTFSFCYSSCKNIYYFGEHYIGLQYTHSPMTISEPPDIIHIIDFKDINNIKKLGIIKLKEYTIGVVTKQNIFIFGNDINGNISVYDNVAKEEYDEKKNPHKSIKLNNRIFSRFLNKICLLNGNRLCIYGDKKGIYVYKINLLI